MIMAVTLDTQAARLLAEIGFLGISRGLAEPSEVVFMALRRVRPDDEAPAIGLAMVALAQGAPDRAVAALRHARQSEAVLAFRSMAHAQIGEREIAEDLLAELEVGNAAEHLIEIARDALQTAAQPSALRLGR